MKLKNCPNCENTDIRYYPNSDYVASCIICTKCPLGVEDCDMSFNELVKIWNSLPRRQEFNDIIDGVSI